GWTFVTFSDELAGEVRGLNRFLFANIYRHKSVMQADAGAGQVVCDLFDAYFSDIAQMLSDGRDGLDTATEAVRATAIADFLAGMTDTYALKEHQRLFDHTPELR